MKTRFIIIRHGFSEANSRQLFAGHSEFPLTEIGKIQAKRCAEALKGEKIDAIYSSDIGRAYETAGPIAASHSLPIIKCEGLREIYAGEWEGLSFEELNRDYAESFWIWRTDLGRACPDGGESVADLFHRIIATLGEIAAENEGKTVCITTHATPVRAVTVAAMGGGAHDMSKVEWTPNASINLFEYENGKISAIYTDRADHLGDICTSLPKNV